MTFARTCAPLSNIRRITMRSNAHSREGHEIVLADAFVLASDASADVNPTQGHGETGGAQHLYGVAAIVFNVKVWEFKDGKKLTGKARQMQAAHQRKVYHELTTSTTHWTCSWGGREEGVELIAEAAVRDRCRARALFFYLDDLHLQSQRSFA